MTLIWVFASAAYGAAACGRNEDSPATVGNQSSSGGALGSGGRTTGDSPPVASGGADGGMPAAGGAEPAGAPSSEGGRTVANEGGSAGETPRGSGGAPEPTTVTIDESTTLVIDANAGGAGGGPTAVFTTPDSPGVVFLRSAGELEVRADNGLPVSQWIEPPYDESPAWFATEAHQTYRVTATEEVTVSFFRVQDEHEVDSQGAPRPGGAGTHEAVMFAGFTDGAAPQANPNITAHPEADWFAIDIPPQAAFHARLSPPANVRGGIALFRSDGTEVSRAFEGTPGKPIDLNVRGTKIAEGGAFVVEVYAFGEPPPAVGSGMVPVNAVAPYTLEITPPAS